MYSHCQTVSLFKTVELKCSLDTCRLLILRQVHYQVVNIIIFKQDRWKMIILQCFGRSVRCVCATCVSERLSAVASSTLSGVDRYRWISKRFSSPDSWESENTVRAFLRRQCFPGNSAWCWNRAGICIPVEHQDKSDLSAAHFRTNPVSELPDRTVLSN